MKILIEESVLRQALETFTHCYAETDRRINERAKLLVELRTALDAAEKVEPVAWSVFDKRTKKHWYTNESKYISQHYANEYSHRESDGTKSMVVVPLYTHPTPATPEGWKGCGECDCEFPCYEGRTRCIRLAAAPEPKP